MIATKIASHCLRHVPILPRRMLLDTPEVEATVPMLRGVWGAALHDLAPAAYRAVFDTGESDAAPPAYLFRPAPPDPRFAPAIDWFCSAQRSTTNRRWSKPGGWRRRAGWVRGGGRS